MSASTYFMNVPLYVMLRHQHNKNNHHRYLHKYTSPPIYHHLRTYVVHHHLHQHRHPRHRQQPRHIFLKKLPGTE